MAVRSLLRYILLAPLQVAVFLTISFPLALFAAVTTFFSVIFLSSRLLLVYVDLIVSVVFASTKTHHTRHRSGQVQSIRPSNIPQRSPPRSPPRDYSGYHAQHSFTAPSSPNISRKRLGVGQAPAQSGFGLGTLSPPLSMKGNIPNMAKGAKSSPSTPFSPNPPPYVYDGGNGAVGSRTTGRNSRRSSIKLSDARDAYSGDAYPADYFSAGFGGRI